MAQRNFTKFLQWGSASGFQNLTAIWELQVHFFPTEQGDLQACLTVPVTAENSTGIRNLVGSDKQIWACN